jgi:large subunit ribosomal protein LP0
MTPQKNKSIPESKIKTVEELKNLIQTKKTVLIASIKNLPASQFQEIGKKLRETAIVKVPKKNMIFKAIEDSGKEAIKKLKEQIKDSVAILFSDLDSFDLAVELIKNKSPAKAKVGQEAPMDITIPEGPTELVPGPAISELGALGIKIQIENGKITIKEPKVIVKQGGKISSGASDIMSKLDIKPFSIGFIPVSSFDTVEEKLYLELKIDREGTIAELQNSSGKALSFAVGIGYVCGETSIIMIQKAGAHEAKLNRVMSGEPEETIVELEKKEDNQPEEKEEKKPEEASAGLASLFG